MNALNPFEVKKRTQEMSIAEIRSTHEAQFQVAFESFMDLLPGVPEDLARRNYIDCTVVRWNGQDYVGFPFRVNKPEYPVCGSRVWCLIDHDGQSTNVFGFDTVSTPGTFVLEAQKVGPDELAALASAGNGPELRTDNLRDSAKLAWLLKYVAEKPDQYPAEKSMYSKVHDLYFHYDLMREFEEEYWIKFNAIKGSL